MRLPLTQYIFDIDTDSIDDARRRFEATVDMRMKVLARWTWRRWSLRTDMVESVQNRGGFDDFVQHFLHSMSADGKQAHTSPIITSIILSPLAVVSIRRRAFIPCLSVPRFG